MALSVPHVVDSAATITRLWPRLAHKLGILQNQIVIASCNFIYI